MAVDQVDRAFNPARDESPGGRLGRSIGRAGRGAADLIRRIIGAAVGLVATAVHAIPGVLRTVVRAARGFLSWVVAAAPAIVHRAGGTLRRAPTPDAGVARAVLGPVHPSTAGPGAIAGDRRPADEPVNATVSAAAGATQETAGTPTGNGHQQDHLEIGQVPGDAPRVLGDAEDAMR
jgi:hypothetical protein